MFEIQGTHAAGNVRCIDVCSWHLLENKHCMVLNPLFISNQGLLGFDAM